jgi:hypothetical protein
MWSRHPIETRPSTVKKFSQLIEASKTSFSETETFDVVPVSQSRESSRFNSCCYLIASSLKFYELLHKNVVHSFADGNGTV